MAREQTVKVSALVLQWARATAGYSLADAAALLKLSETALADLEAGTEPPGRTLLREMARLYKRAYVVLLLPEPPKSEHIPTDYRTLPGPGTILGPDSAYALREARRLQETITDLLEEDANLFPFFSPNGYSMADPATPAGTKFRQRMNVPVSDQQRWTDSAYAFRAWRASLQTLGIMVLVGDFPREECRGFSLWAPDMVPTIVVTKHEAPAAQIFTLFHEVGHVLLQLDALCLKQEREDIPGRVEAWCNRFAAATLVPEEEFLACLASRFPEEEFLASRSMDYAFEWPPEALQGLAKQFKVSRHVVAIRLEELEFAPDGYYRRVRHLLEADDKRPAKLPGPSKSRPSDAPRERLAAVGFGPAQAILRACKETLLSTSEAAELLGLRPTTFRRFEELATRQKQIYLR